MVSRLPALVLEILIKIQILRLHSPFTISESLGIGPKKLHFSVLPKCILGALRFGNCGSEPCSKSIV